MLVWNILQFELHHSHYWLVFRISLKVKHVVKLQLSYFSTFNFSSKFNPFNVMVWMYVYILYSGVLTWKVCGINIHINKLIYDPSQYQFGSDVTSALVAFKWSRGRGATLTRGDTLAAYSQSKRWFYLTSLPNCWWFGS